MKQSVFLLTLCVFLAMAVGFMLYPQFYGKTTLPVVVIPVPGGQTTADDSVSGKEPLPPLPTQEGIVANDGGGVTVVGLGGGEGIDSSGAGGGVGGENGEIVDSWDDESWEEDSSDTTPLAGERDLDSYMPEEMGEDVQDYLERAVPVDPTQAALPGSYSQGDMRKVRRSAERLARVLEREAADSDRKGYFKASDLTAAQWANAAALREQLLTRVMSGIGSLNSENLWLYLQEPANRLDVARMLLIDKAGASAVSEVAGSLFGGRLLETLGNDLGWMYGLLYSGPTQHLDKALRYLSAIYARHSEDWNDPLLRRVATTTALEFAREGWPEKEMLARCEYYYSSARQGKLNAIFDTLQYWETRLVTGCTEYDGWGSVRSLTWQRDNVRLPAEGYLSACNQVKYRLRNVAGDSIFSGDYLAPIRKYTNHVTAWAHREMGGVCGACSHYGAYGALAVGIPAMTMGEPGHCAYTVRIGNRWEKSYSIYWQHGMHKTFWGETGWDFLDLMQQLYSQRFETLAADQMLALAELLAAERKITAAATAYEEAVIAQPLHWEAWLRFTGYLKKQGPMNKEKWKEAHDLAVSTIAGSHHHAAATLLRKYVYPSLLPLVSETKERNKLFASFFDACETYGTNRWEIAPLLNVQMATCRTDEERLDYMKEALRILMGKQDYAPGALSWGLDYLATLPQTADSEEINEDFYKMVLSALSRTRSTGKNKDTAWRSLGEAIAATADNGDRRAFQAIGKLAQRKFRSKFPRNRFKFRSVGGKVLSGTALITTATTLTEDERANSCLHWGVLQRTGGRMPGKFEGDAGIVVELEKAGEINGAVCILAENAKTDRPFRLQVSEDGQNWQTLCSKAEINGAVLRMPGDNKQKKTGRFVRLTREGEKYEPDILAFYVYGRTLKD